MKNRIIKKTMMMVETLIPKQERRWDLDVMVMTGWKENRRRWEKTSKRTKENSGDPTYLELRRDGRRGERRTLLSE